MGGLYATLKAKNGVCMQTFTSYLYVSLSQLIDAISFCMKLCHVQSAMCNFESWMHLTNVNSYFVADFQFLFLTYLFIIISHPNLWINLRVWSYSFCKFIQKLCHSSFSNCNPHFFHTFRKSNLTIKNSLDWKIYENSLLILLLN